METQSNFEDTFVDMVLNRTKQILKDQDEKAENIKLILKQFETNITNDEKLEKQILKKQLCDIYRFMRNELNNAIALLNAHIHSLKEKVKGDSVQNTTSITFDFIDFMSSKESNLE